MNFNKNTYLILALRYKELFKITESEPGTESVPFEIDSYLTEIDTDLIDADYMNSRFEKYLKTLKQENADEEQIQQTLNELHKSFASLNQEEQKYAGIFLRDTQSGNITIESGKTFREYITEYQSKAQNFEIYNIANLLGLNEVLLKDMINSNITDENINNFGHFDELKKSANKTKTKAYFEEKEGIKIPPFKVNMRLDKFLRKFIISGEVEM